MSVEEDPIGQVYGPERSGRRVRGMTKVSKTKLKHLAIVQSVLDDFASQKSEIQDIKCTLITMAGLMQTLVEDKESNIAPASLTTSAATVSTTPTTMPAHTPSNMDTQCGLPDDSQIPFASPTAYHTPHSTKLYGFSHGNLITLGEANPKATPGTLVHTRPLQENEHIVRIIKVMDGMENEPLYMKTQGGSTIIGDFIGAFVVWRFALMRLAS